MQFVENLAWIPALKANYALGADGISVALIVLTTLTTVLVVIGSWGPIEERVAQYMAAMLALEGLLIGVFAATDALLFYVFFEGMLIPMFIIIGVWGGPRRVYATLKFFIYTFFGSDLHARRPHLPAHEGRRFRADFVRACGPRHARADVALLCVPARLRDQGADVARAYVVARRARRGADRWLGRAGRDHAEGRRLRFHPLLAAGYAGCIAGVRVVVIALSLIAIVYIGYVALVQEDMKKLIAYSSIAHMGFVTLGVFIALALVRSHNNPMAARLGVSGAMVQMISHGFVSGAMFSCIGVMYDRLHTRMIRDYGGIANVMPWFATFFVLFAMANCGLPGTSGFVGEFMVILAAFQDNFWIAALAAFTLIIGAAYTLWLVKRVIFGKIENPKVAKMQDLNVREWIVLGTSPRAFSRSASIRSRS